MIMPLSSGRTIVFVDVLNAYECPIGHTVPVEIEYIKDVEKSYGADADGQRGTMLVSIEIIEMAIDQVHLRSLTSAQVERILQDAEAILQERNV